MYEDAAREDPTTLEPPLRISGDAARYDHREGNDDYSQARALHDLMNSDEQARLYSNTAAAMDGVPDEVIDRVLVHYDKISQAYGDGIRAARKALSASG
ncbi:catalase-related domain-containing protein [uncultured Aliiroseovarius sp.]|uniref:catalase-related domain-containing protein n=1 Tax=uncultured Aliiroseovarius sp. TaxID=1658783 RepID=UPI00342C1BD1